MRNCRYIRDVGLDEATTKCPPDCSIRRYHVASASVAYFKPHLCVSVFPAYIHGRDSQRRPLGFSVDWRCVHSLTNTQLESSTSSKAHGNSARVKLLDLPATKQQRVNKTSMRVVHSAGQQLWSDAPRPEASEAIESFLRERSQNQRKTANLTRN